MKSIILPIILLISVLAFVITVGFSTNSSLSDLIKQTNALPDNPDEHTLDEINKIEKEWNKHKEIYSAIIKFDFVYNFSKEISAAKAGCTADDPGTYLAAKKSMVNILEYIRDVQRLRLDNII